MRSADEALLATLPPAIMAEAQALQARMQRHMARNQAMTEAMQAAAQQVGRLSACSWCILLVYFAQTKPRSARCQPWLPALHLCCRRRLWQVCSPAMRLAAMAFVYRSCLHVLAGVSTC